jgi:Flp pilus assembly protein TadG
MHIDTNCKQGVRKMTTSIQCVIRKLRKGQMKRGQSIVLIMIAMPALLGILTLLIDVGDLYVTRVRLQTACDTAALAGANYLPNYQSQAVSTSQSYALANGLAVTEINSITVAADGKSVAISTTRQVPCIFCLALGASTAHADETGTSGSSNGVSASATAVIVPVKSAIGIVPLGVDYRTNLNFGNQVTLHQGQIGAGNWDSLALGGTGGSNYSNNLANGYPSLQTVGDLLTTEPGNKIGPTQTGVNTRVSNGSSQFPSGTFGNHDLSDPRVVTVPLVDWSNINGRSETPLKGFAKMWLVSVSSNGNVTCYFIQESVPNSVPDPTGSTAYGTVTPTLLK